LSQAKWRTLAHLSRGHLTQCDLAQRLGIEEPTLARLLGKLEQDRWIKRESAIHDRRCKTVHLRRSRARCWKKFKRLPATCVTNSLKQCHLATCRFVSSVDRDSQSRRRVSNAIEATASIARAETDSATNDRRPKSGSCD
jgi:DNA-binding MarR family transcriptional regulator